MARVARRAKSTTFVPDNITRVYFAERYGEAREGGGRKRAFVPLPSLKRSQKCDRGACEEEDELNHE